MNLKQQLLKNLQKQIKEPFNLETPPNPNLGDYSLPCFKLSKSSIELQKLLKLPKFVEKTEIKGLYLNFFINKSYLTESVIKQILKERSKYGSLKLKNKKALIEHTSINPNASPHLGRARNAIIGDSIVRILKFHNYKVETHYYVNDIGKQIAMLVLACDNKTPSFKDILELYISFNQKLENNQELEKKVFNLLNKLEKGDKKTKAQFKKIVSLCLKGQTSILKELGINYDYFDFESDFLEDTNKILKDLEKTGKLFTDEENRKAINLEEFDLPMENPYLPLTRNDGTSMYMLRDIAYSIYKEKRAKDRNIITLGEDQKLYFQQLSNILKLLNHIPPESIHYSFVLLPSGKMSTRKGEVVLLEDFMNEIKNKAKEEIIKRHGNIKDIEKLSKTIGYGAVKFTILKVAADKNITFEIEKALSFEGESAPYIQYAYTRANSILNKSKIKSPNNFKLLTNQYEIMLVQKLSLFPEITENTLKKLQPSLIATYSLDLSKTFNEFYQNCNVLDSQENLKQARLKLVFATSIVLKNALNLLGIETPEIM